MAAPVNRIKLYFDPLLRSRSRPHRALEPSVCLPVKKTPDWVKPIAAIAFLLGFGSGMLFMKATEPKTQPEVSHVSSSQQ